MMKKGSLAAVGFEPTPPRRLVPKTRALDHSATLPDALELKHWRCRETYYLSELACSRHQVVVRLNGKKEKAGLRGYGRITHDGCSLDQYS